MEDYFAQIEQNEGAQPQPNGDEPQSTEQNTTRQAAGVSFDYNPPNESTNEGDNQFDDFEEDQTTKRIREDEQRIKLQLKRKSDEQWQEKQKRKEAGRKALEEFINSKQREKEERAQDNVRMEEAKRQEWAKLNQTAGWKKVVKNINMRQGEHKLKDTSRMRLALLHKEEDQR